MTKEMSWKKQTPIMPHHEQGFIGVIFISLEI